MNSCLYKATVMHHRLEPRPHRFYYRVFMFYLDLDEVDQVTKKIFWISRNRFNLFSFRDGEHLRLPAEYPDSAKNVKQHLVAYLKKNGFEYNNEKIMLLTNLNVLGYNFNPVSFYFVMSRENQACCAIAEVSNTFREMKMYFIGKENLKDHVFTKSVTKYFYVSPFIDHDAQFDFNLQTPAEKLNIRIDDSKNGKRFFISTLTGKRYRLSNVRVLGFFLMFPFITLRIISLIHWNAFLLWTKKIRFYKKEEGQHLQKDVLKKYNKI